MKKLLSVILIMAVVFSSVAVSFAGKEDDQQILSLDKAPLILASPEDHNVMLAVSSVPAQRVAAGFDPLPVPDALKLIQDFGKKNKTAEASRGDIIALLWNISNKPYVNYWMQYEDMDYAGPNTEAYRWAASEKILQGFGSGVSAIDDPISLEQLATFLYRHTILLGNDTSKVQENTNTLSYDGIFDVSSWATEADHWALAAGVIVPPDGVHHPHDTVTRQEAATILTRYINCPKTITNPTIKFSDNLPEIKMNGSYTAVSTAGYEGDDELLCMFEGTEKSECDLVCCYRWKASKSLLAEAKADAKKYFPNQEIEFKESDTLYTKGDADYVYYVAYGPNAKMYYLEWYYMDNGYVYQAEAAFKTTEVQIPGTDSSFALPRCMEATEITAPDAVLQFKSNYPAFADLAVYIDAPDFDFSKENIEKEWGVSNVVISDKKYSSGKAGGHFGTYAFSEDGKTYDAEIYVIKLDDCYLNFEFITVQGAKHADWATDSNRAIITSGH